MSSSSTYRPLFLIELNEINFDAVRDYARDGHLPVLAEMIDKHGVSTTESETRYEDLEPWIQWVTAHTGLSLAEHGVFRLGDIVNADFEQIWEKLESKGLTVGAISPMNAKNRLRAPKFFVPDPWTETPVTGSFVLRRLYGSIAQAVNDNSQSRITLRSLFWLLLGAARYARPGNYFRYLRYALKARRQPWFRAMILDLLLADVFVRLSRSGQPDFASLFVNAGAHIQHHYMFNSRAYRGTQKNPEWYVDPSADPVLDVYRMYDEIVGAIRASFPNARIMLATGLHQDPHPELTYYWRLVDHAAFLQKIGAEFDEVQPRMSRDFLVRCKNDDAARRCQARLEAAVAADGLQLFDVDNRGSDLFVMLTYPRDIGAGFTIHVGDESFHDFRRDVAFVAIKNGQHNGIGYFIDTGRTSPAADDRFPLTEMPQRILAALL